MLGTMTPSDRQRWAEILAHPYRKDVPANYLLWDWLHRITDAEAPAAVMATILHAKLLTKVPEHERGNALWLELMAALCPASHRQELREQLLQFDAAQTVNPLALLEILDGMENDRTHA
jgi:hypothetical protein